MSFVLALLRKDVRVVYRDSLLVFLPVYAVLLALGMRWGVRFLPVADLGLYLAPSVVLFSAILLGTVLGFALVEEREQGTWLLLRVLPLAERSLFLYLAGTATLFSAAVGFIAARVYAYPVSDWGAWLRMLFAGSLLAPVVMLVLGGIASNKVEGLAVSKLLSAVLMMPGLVFLIPMPWQVALAWLPAYWVYLGLLEAYAGDPGALSALYWPGYPSWLMFSAPVVISLAATWALAKRFRSRAI